MEAAASGVRDEAPKSGRRPLGWGQESGDLVLKSNKKETQRLVFSPWVFFYTSESVRTLRCLS